jgi:hypothetical protein
MMHGTMNVKITILIGFTVRIACETLDLVDIAGDEGQWLAAVCTESNIWVP